MCKDITQSERKDPKESYSKELYNVCKYMIEHSEEFKEFKIHESLNIDVDVDYKSEIFLSLHNRLISQYNFLTGKKIESDEESVKDSDIIPVIDISYLNNPKILSQILALFHHFINKEKTIKKLKKTMLNVDVDKSDEMIDYLINKINTENVGCNSLKQLNDARRQMKEKLKDDFKEKYKFEARDHEADYRQQIKFFEEKLIDNINLYYAEFGNLTTIFQVWLYIDLCCWAILQFVINGIIRNKQDKNKMESIEKLNNVILSLIELEKKEKSSVKLEGTPEEMMFSISSYYYERDKYLQDIAVLDYITKPEKNEEILLQNTP